MLVPALSLTLEHHIFQFYPFLKPQPLIHSISQFVCEFTQIFTEHLNERHHAWLEELEGGLGVCQDD